LSTKPNEHLAETKKVGRDSCCVILNPRHVMVKGKHDCFQLTLLYAFFKITDKLSFINVSKISKDKAPNSEHRKFSYSL
jgi:hypothetical protein